MIEITGTKKAFQKLIAERGIATRLGIDRARVSKWKAHFKNPKLGESISLELMEELLQKAGSKVVQEKVWDFPSDKSVK